MNEVMPGKMAMSPAPATTTSSNMAMVVDKRPPQRPGGCVGIFFQLFDWNRRFAKKKLFSRKLLPHVRAAKRISKKFTGDEKMPRAKLLLIADENRGGFPKKPEADAVRSSSSSNGMCSPGLVARLMGLETMPTVPHDKPRKTVDSDFYFDRHSETSGGSSSRHDQDLNLEKGGHGKVEPSRPQKLQKTGFFDRRPVVAARLGAEVLHFNRSMLTRSRKQHHKLASPVKSPRLLSRRSSARLMEAATRILEPGLQNRNRAKGALTYMGSLQQHANGGGIEAPSLKRSKEPSKTTFVSPCKSCGSLVEVADVRLNVEEPLVMEYGSNGSSASEFSNASSSPSSHEGSNESALKPAVSLKVESRVLSLAVQAKTNVQNRTNEYTVRKPRQQNDHLPDLSKRQHDAAQRCGSNQNNLRQSPISLVKERVVPGPKLCSRQQATRDSSPVNASKNFISLNRNLNNCTRTRTAPKALDSRIVEMERNALDRKSLVRKRRSINSPQIENVNASNATLSKQRSIRSDIHAGRGPSLISSHSLNPNCIKNESRKREGDSGCSSKDTGAISFSFKAPIGNDSGPLSSIRATEKRRGRPKVIHDDTSQSDKTDKKTGKTPSQGVTTITGDALSALLEQKIRELTCLDRDELATGGVLSARSAASILEELISALTAGGPIPQKKCDNSSVEYSPKDDSRCDSKDLSDCIGTHGPKLNINQKFRTCTKSGASTGLLLANDYDQPSPVSILEASFSNDSCISDSLNSSPGNKLLFGFTERSCDKSQSWDPDTDLSDSATSINITTIGPERMPNYLDSISLIHNVNHPCEVGPTRSKSNYIWEVISNAELLFGNISPIESDGTVDSSIEPILLDTLEILVDALWVSPKYNLSSTESEGTQFRRFLFDCIIEHLDVKYSRYCKSGYKAWTKLPSFFSTDRLTTEVYEQIRSCRDLAGKILDEIIDNEMSCRSGEWADLEIEAFEMGMNIESNILHTLVDEMIIDLSRCRSM